MGNGRRLNTHSQAHNSYKKLVPSPIPGHFCRKYIVSWQWKRALKGEKKKTTKNQHLSRDFKETPWEYHFTISLADTHQSLFRYNTADCIHAMNNMERDIALFLRILYKSSRAIRNCVRNTLNAEDNQLLGPCCSWIPSLSAFPTRLPAVPESGWV